MNTMNENAQAMTQATITSLTEAVTAIATQLKDLVDLAKAESTVAATATTTEVTATTETATTAVTTTPETTTATETTATTETTTATTATETTTATADEEDNTEFKGSMIEQDPMDLIPAAEAKADTAAEAKADTAAEEYLDNISCDISTLYDISTYTLENEGYNIDTDHSPYAPMDNRSGSFDNCKVYISKEIIKAETITGEFRMIVSEKNSGVKILDHSLKIIDNTIKVFSSENTVRIEKLKDSKKLFRLLEIVEEVSALVMSKYISK